MQPVAAPDDGPSASDRAREENPSGFRGDDRPGNRVGGAARFGALLAAGLIAGCAAFSKGELSVRVHTAPPPSDAERYCAWFGDAGGDTLYFGQSAFWAASRAAGPAGNPLGDLEHPGPVLVGRFDLETEQLLEPLDVGSRGASTGAWDVLAHPNGRVYFSSYFENSGWVDPESGEVGLLPELGPGLNELALATDGRIFATRYPSPYWPGGLVVLDETGALLNEYTLPAPPGYLAGPKSVAVDPIRGEIWLSMDLLPDASAAQDLPILHDAYVLDANGALLRTIERPHLHFPVFARDGTGYRAEVEDAALWLRTLEPDSDPFDDEGGVRQLLDPDFSEGFDFAQEVRPLPDGGAIVTRWSGLVHRVDAAGRVHTLRLPPQEPPGLYYTAVLRDGRVCATHCGDVSVVCADAPTGETSPAE